MKRPMTPKSVAVSNRLKEEIYRIVEEVCPYDFTPRKVSWSWNTLKCRRGGVCRMNRNEPDKARIEVYTNVKTDLFVHVVVHEIIHACLPMDEKHGILFQRACKAVNARMNGLNVGTYLPPHAFKEEPYKYVVHWKNMDGETGSYKLIRTPWYVKYWLSMGYTHADNMTRDKGTGIQYWVECL